MKLTFVLAGITLALSACNLTQNLGGGGGAGTSSTTSTISTTSSSQPASCKDGIENGNETDVDCGGATCPTCAAGKRCLVNTDCASGDCVGNVCHSGTGVSCTDGIQDGIETDVDCGGGTCPACATGKKCLIDADCTSGDCVASVCQAGTGSTCTDGFQDGTETDVDCGGSTCSACSIGKKCLADSDCTSNACDALALICTANQCSDHRKDGNETDVDCGGGTCPTCAVGQHCAVDSDCVSGDCVAGVCQSGTGSTCSDGVKDGTETDIDCGGGTCSACAVGKKCLIDSDCTSNACDTGTSLCVASQCGDHHQDGNETDVDCGGNDSCARCANNQKCLVDSDCASNACDAVALVCVANQCADHRQDGNETDVDCGGGTCATCATGKHCAVNADCTSDSCVANVCH